MIITFPADRVRPVRRVLFPEVLRFRQKAAPMEQALAVPALTTVIGIVAWMTFVGFMFQLLGLGAQSDATKRVARSRGH